MARRSALLLPLLAGLLVLAVACRRPQPQVTPRPVPPPAVRPLARLGYTIQAGAFAKVENAARLAARLRDSGLEATHYPGNDGLYRVRFGDFPTREAARQRAEELRRAGTIEVFYLVAPAPVPLKPQEAAPGIRADLVRTAESFLGVPYLWGGTSADSGFDCSGLAQAVYRLNGLRLPRSSREQYGAGTPVSREELAPGDLLFFSSKRAGTVTHVAVYVGGGAFIHAPGQGRVIRRDTLANPVLGEQFLGGRAYLATD